MTDTGSPAPNAPVLSAERRAIEIALRALEVINAIASPNPHRTMVDGVIRDLDAMTGTARRALADIRALVPDAGEHGQ